MKKIKTGDKMSMFNNILDKMRKIHESKNNDYSPEGEFGNFSESERVGVEPWRGAFVRLQDKYTRCCNLIRGKEQMVKNEALEDTLLDLANYAVIVLCLRRIAENKLKSKDINETDYPNTQNLEQLFKYNEVPDRVRNTRFVNTQEEDEAFEMLALQHQSGEK